MTCFRISVCCLICWTFFGLLAQSEPAVEATNSQALPYQVHFFVSGSGAVVAGAAGYRLGATSGLAVVDSARNERFRVQSGFWFFGDFLVGIQTPEMSPLPNAFSLQQNFPNPFNPQTTIRYELPVISEVSIEVFNILGQRVARLVQVRQPAGRYEVVWEGTDAAGKGVANGVYFYRMTAISAEGKRFVATRRMLMVK